MLADRLLPRAVTLALLWPELQGPRTGMLLFGDDEPHTLGAAPLLPATADWDVVATWGLVPAPGDPQGLPPGVAARAAEAGEACVLQHRDGRTSVLVPDVMPFGSDLEPGVLVRWRSHDAAGVRAPVGSPGEARLALHEAMTHAIDELTALDVARERPELREAFLDLTGTPDSRTQALTYALDDRRAELLVRAFRLLEIVRLASQDEGAAVTATTMGARGAVLLDLARAARTAVGVATAQRT
ncbi:hypothetical protein [Litorihabitans aurantiacus]|uniref:Uncharacterized protein n=1 Tax=Litorihabitans aurantiacus TaxID=1930061 RepID=A0AA37UHT4_9MICO|nr:hypothetical protein [Litorihabitans aurantiacus]GMA31053.1 hypothetical protein GCM10025875_10450 [Litorihabitans aurantiacus]